MQVAKPVKDVANAAHYVAKAFLFEVNFSAETFLDGAPLPVEAIDLR
jgi:hypothetical protein